MARRGENIRKRADGRWEGRYHSGLKENGDIKYTSVYAHSYSECKAKLESKKSLSLSGINAGGIKIKFKDILFQWLSVNKIRIKGSTEAKYENMIKTHILPELGSFLVSELNPTVINIFLERKLKNGKTNGKGGLSPSYVKTIAIIIESALKYAQNEGYCPPQASPILKPMIKKKELKIMSGETQRLLESALLDNMDETKLGIYIVLQTGLRLGEICALKWEDIDFNSKVINIRNTVSRILCDNGEEAKSKLIIDSAKTEASVRKIPISSALFPVLVNMQKSAASKFVVSNEKKFVSTRTFEYRYKSLLRKYGIDEINFHALRHTFATRCIEAGVDVKTLSEILGHSNAAITLNTYVHPSMEAKRAQIEKLYMQTA